MEIDIIKSPAEYFRYYFDETLFDQIVFQSNLYSIQQNSNKPLRLTRWELEQYIGVFCTWHVQHYQTYVFTGVKCTGTITLLMLCQRTDGKK